MSDTNSDSEKEPTVVRAERFELVGPEGEVRATLGFTEHGSPNLSFFDKDGSPRVSLGPFKSNWTGVGYVDEDEEIRSLLGLGEGILPLLSLLDKNGEMRASIVLGDDGVAAANFFDDSQKVRLGVGVRKDGLPDVVLFDTEGKRPGGTTS